MAAYAPLNGNGAGRARLSRQRLGRTRNHRGKNPRRRCEGGRERGAGACAGRRSHDRRQAEESRRGGVIERLVSRSGNRTEGGNTMKLTQQQIDDFNREGWLFLPELFSMEEVALLAREAEGIYDTKRPEVWREKSGAPRTAFAAHLYNEAFGLLGAHPRMIDPVEQVFGEKVYMHQYKINAKSGR